jgi:hypothetical protein
MVSYKIMNHYLKKQKCNKKGGRFGHPFLTLVSVSLFKII